MLLDVNMVNKVVKLKPNKNKITFYDIDEPDISDTDIKLLPCPFCGNPAQIEDDMYLLKRYDKGRIYHVICSMKSCGMGSKYVGTKREVAARWNLRKEPIKKKLAAHHIRK